MRGARRAVTALLLCTLAARVVTATLSRQVCYITNWAQYRSGSVGGKACAWRPKDLNATLCTHINYSFAFLNPDYSLKPIEYNDAPSPDLYGVSLYEETIALRKKNPNLKILIAVGGWSMNDPGSAYVNLFANAVKPANRASFIQKAIAFLDQYGFDGLDMDWEYPADLTRGGTTSDKVNFAAFCKEFKAEVARQGKPYLLTMAAGASANGWQGLDLPSLGQSLDYINLMTYDFHGAWDQAVNFHTPWVDPLGGTFDISHALDYFINQGQVPPSKINLGLGAYGRSWTLADPKKTTVGSAAYSPGNTGPCTGESGYIGWFEIKALIDKGAKVTIDEGAKAAYLVSGSQWVGFDLPQTLYMKILAARQLGLGGVMLWEASLDDAANTVMSLMKYQQDPGPFTQNPTPTASPPPLSTAKPPSPRPPSPNPPGTAATPSPPTGSQPNTALPPPSTLPSTSPPSNPSGCQSQDAACFCQGGKTGMFADAAVQCTAFYECPATGPASWRQCPQGLRFNEAAGYCDWPDNVPCDGTQQPTATSPPPPSIKPPSPKPPTSSKPPSPKPPPSPTPPSPKPPTSSKPPSPRPPRPNPPSPRPPRPRPPAPKPRPSPPHPKPRPSPPRPRPSPVAKRPPPAPITANPGDINIDGAYCGNGSVGNGACLDTTLCCSLWGHCGTGFEYCSSDKGYCMGGPCKDYSGRPIAQGAPVNNGTSLFDNLEDYLTFSKLRGPFGAPAYSAK